MAQDVLIPRGDALSRMIKAGRHGANRFLDVGREAFRYGYAKDHKFDYQEWDVELSFFARVSATQQFIQTIGAYLYRQNPIWRVGAKKFANERASMRAPVYQEYLNYVTGEDHLYTEMRACLNDAMTYGRGCLWHGVHPTKTGVITTTHDSVENLIVDPSVTCFRDAGWVARRRRMPKWELATKYPRHKKAILRLPSVPKLGDTQSEWEDEGYDDLGTGLVEVHEVYMKDSLANYRGGIKLSGENAQGEDGPRKYVVTSTDKVLYSGPWETPYHLDDEWPVTILDFHEHPTEPWPVSPLQAGLCWQRALNLIATMIVVKHRFTARNLYALLDTYGVDVDQEDMEQILASAKTVEVLKVKVKGLMEQGKLPDVSHLIQRLDTSGNMQDDINVYQFAYEQFQKHTGLYEVLHAGNTGRQMRSAQEAVMKEKFATNRIEDMASRVEEFMSRLGRKAMFTALFWMGPEEIEPILGPEAAMAWGSLMSPEELNPEFQMQQILEELPPDAQENPMVMEAVAAQAQEIVDSGYSIEQVVRETDVGIEGGSLRRRTPEQEAEAAIEANNQLVPMLLQIGAYEAAAPFIMKFAESIGSDREQVAAIRASFERLLGQQQAMQQQQPQGAQQG